MEDLLPRVAHTISQYHLLAPHDCVLLAVSGGSDSTAMLDILFRFSQQYSTLTLGLFYLDHGLRPEAVQEAEYIRSLAASYCLPAFIEHVDLDSDGDSALEERARRYRYQCLEEQASRFGATKVAVAHHADDQIETVLLHLLKGTGIQGLGGMPFMRPLHNRSAITLVRPLLALHKEEIIAYLRQRGLRWCEDISNFNPKFSRNRVRHCIIPELKHQGYPELGEAILRTARHCHDIAAHLDSEAEVYLQKARRPWCARADVTRFLTMVEGKDNIVGVANDIFDTMPAVLLPFFVHRAVATLSEEEISIRESHYRMLTELRGKTQGSIRLSSRFLVWRTELLTSFIDEGFSALNVPQELPVPGYVSISPSAAIRAGVAETTGENPNVPPASLLDAALDYHLLQPPLQVRAWQPSDSVQPLGAPGRRKVARILTDLKIPLPVRPRIVVVADRQGEIVWLPGICIAHPYRLTPATRQILCLNTSV